MHASSYRCARRTPLPYAIALLLIAATCLPVAHAALDEGTFDFSQPGSTETVGWAWSPDSTSDGDGVEYRAYLASFEHAGPSNPSVTTTVAYQSGVSHQSLQAFVAWIVANNAHVASSSDLTIVKYVATTVTLP